MSSGDMWWAKTTVAQTNTPGQSAPGFSWQFVPEGVQLSGVVIGPTVWQTTSRWQVEIRAEYFLDPPRMPTTGEPFVSLPKMTFQGGLALAGGLNEATAIGQARAQVTFKQILRWDDDEVASSSVDWTIGIVHGKNLMLGKKSLAPQERDYGALFFNLDRSRTLNITLLTTFRFEAVLGGVVGFGPLVVAAPQWKVHSLDA